MWITLMTFMCLILRLHKCKCSKVINVFLKQIVSEGGKKKFNGVFLARKIRAAIQ